MQYVTQRMEEVDAHSKPGKVFFGQLLGMCDHVSFRCVCRGGGLALSLLIASHLISYSHLSLGHAGYSAYKYVPYGPIKEVIPYLIRRAQVSAFAACLSFPLCCCSAHPTISPSMCAGELFNAE